MVRFVKFLFVSVFCAFVLGGCDLQPKIASIPDSIGEFISERYPALLADPETQPEIYNSAVTDYGVYASPELYGSDSINDYVLYASKDDYILEPQKETTEYKNLYGTETSTQEDYLVVPNYTVQKSDSDFVIVERGDTLYSIAKKHDTTVAELAKINSLKSPYTLSIGQKLQIRTTQKQIQSDSKVVVVQKQIQQEPSKQIQPAKAVVQEQSVKRVAVKEISVKKGDTLYSLSREYQIPVNDLAVMNKLSSPFTLSVGQKIKVPMLNSVATTTQSKVTAQPVVTTKAKQTDVKITKQETFTQQKVKISSNPNKQLPQISGRSSSKFSWPVRGKILSQYGAKNNGLFNDGINIAAAQGTNVRAAENGVVAYAGNEVKGMGNLIIIQHSDGWMTVYAHLDSMSVRRGTRVSVGDVIGKIGKTGKVDTPQLHFEIRKGTKAYDPVSYLKK